jgi:hypothetical protein
VPKKLHLLPGRFPLFVTTVMLPWANLVLDAFMSSIAECAFAFVI